MDSDKKLLSGKTLPKAKNDQKIWDRQKSSQDLGRKYDIFKDSIRCKKL